MARQLRSVLGFGLTAALAGVAGAAEACMTCKPPPPPPPACCSPPPTCCNVPNYHQVNVPGIVITPPQIIVNTPVIAISAAQAVASASAEAIASVNVNAAVNANTNAFANSQSNIFAVGGGSNYSIEQSNSSFVPNLSVEGSPVSTPPICVAYSSVIRAVAIQAECLDDKSVPHPASQVSPDRDVADAYEGEVYRCIAGARMQYTMAEFAGRADFNHGQTVVCQKGDALYHSARGGMQCRPQRAARDCNERSLLRRFGAGIKVVHVARASVCTRYEGGAQTAAASTGGAILLDGGVGGVVR